MFINPHEEDSLRVFASNSLREWQRNSLLDSSCIVSALDGIFGFSQNTLRDGYYNGTLFWFPLRRRYSDLSRSVYQKKTVDELLMSFMKDAVNILLFLSHLEKIEVFCKVDSDRSEPQKLFSICIGGNVHQYRQENNTFTREIRRTGKGIASDSVHFNSEIIIHTEILENDFTYKHDFQKWLIVKLLKCSGVSKTFQSLIQDEDMPYCPCVGVASPLESDKKNFKGHVFCTLPLPLPGMQGTESLTNLPVHVNGIFALNQNRSQLEWTTWDQPITNSYTQWNEHMLIEALPEAYHLLLSTLISISESIQNRNDDKSIEADDDKSVEAVYKCIPETNGVGIWTNLSKMFLQRIVHDKIIFTKDDGGKWIRPEEATIASFETFTVDRDIEKTVKETLQMYGVNFAEVPNHVLRLLKNHRLANDITPSSLSKILCSDHTIYQSLTKDQKLNLLGFLLYDDNQYSVEGLELLPLANGMFAKFIRYGTPVFMATAEDIGIFTYFRDQLVNTVGLPLHVCEILRNGNYIFPFSPPAHISSAIMCAHLVSFT